MIKTNFIHKLFLKKTLLLAVVLGAVAFLPGVVEAACAQIAIPSYFYPGALWKQSTAVGAKVGFMIANPASGPGVSVDSNYLSAIASAQAAGVKVLGYVHTSYGARAQSEINAEIDKFQSWYKVDGIFFDETADSASKFSYYQEIANYVRTKPGRFVMINPGVYPDESYISLADVSLVFENSYSAYQSISIPAYVSRYPANKFYHVVYGAADASALNSAMSLAGSRNAGYVFVTNDGLPNPYDSLPPYFSAEVSQACGGGATPAPVPAPTPTPTPVPMPTPSLDPSVPKISILSPANAALVKVRKTVSISVSASADVGVRRVRILIDDELLCTKTSAPYVCSWQVPRRADRSYDIQAVVQDGAGRQSSQKIRVTSY